MLAIAISVLFGLIAFAALVQIQASVHQGIRQGHAILAELAGETRVTVRARPATRLHRPEWRPGLAAA